MFRGGTITSLQGEQQLGVTGQVQDMQGCSPHTMAIGLFLLVLVIFWFMKALFEPRRSRPR